MITVYLLGPGAWFGHTWFRQDLIEHTNLAGTIGLSIAILGGIIACRARYMLGKNWSRSIQRKENHELIQSGIYKVIRHPIYTSLLLLFIGNAIIVGDNRIIIAIILNFVALG